MGIFKAIVASTFTDKQDIDYRRVSYIMTPKSINELTRQLNLARENGNPVKIMFETDSLNVKKNQIKQSDFEKVVGEVVSAETVTDKQYNVQQTQATVYIENDEFYNELLKNKDQICIFPIIGTHPQKSFDRKIIINENIDDVKILNDYFKIVAMNVGLRRSSSNVFLSLL